jgi:hypothetical protein
VESFLAPNDDVLSTAQDVRSLAPFFTGSIRKYPLNATIRTPPKDLTRHFAFAIAHLHHPAVREWAEALLEERKALWEARGLGEEEQEGIKGVRVGSKVDAAKSATAASAATNGHGV